MFFCNVREPFVLHLSFLSSYTARSMQSLPRPGMFSFSGVHNREWRPPPRFRSHVARFVICSNFNPFSGHSYRRYKIQSLNMMVFPSSMLLSRYHNGYSSNN